VTPLTYLLHASRPLVTALLMAVSLPALSMETTVVTSLLPPFTSPDTPERPGLYVEVAKAAFERAGLPFSIEFQPWARAQANTLATPGLFILGLAHTPERDGKFKFAAEIASHNICFISLKPHASINSFDQARNSGAITVRSGTVFEALLRNAGLANIDLSQTDEQNARKLSNGRVQTWLTYDLAATSTWRSINGDPTDLVIGTPIQREAIFLAAAKETSDETIKKLHDAVQSLHADGTYDRIYQKYFGR
jgi:polar amino acid transport system substrate-binding protein